MTMQKENKLKYIFVELINHLPFSIFGVILGMIMMGVLTFLAIIANGEELLPQASHELFHVFHASHILFSAIATTAMFWKHEKSLIKATLVGFLGSISICGLSDAIFPYVGGLLLGGDMHVHICLFEHVELVLVFATVGVLAGLTVTRSFEKSTEYSHSAHVFISSAASILYLTGYGMGEWE